jgi:Tol biopolymer transport system component
LTSNNKGDSYPSISGDGTIVAFQQGFDNATEIFVVNSDGSGLTQLTSNNAEDRYPSFSDSGERIVFESNGDIYIVSYALDGAVENDDNSVFPAEIIVGSLIAVAIVTTLSVVIYLKRKKG